MATERPITEVERPQRKLGTLIVITGLSAVGKDKVVNLVCEPESPDLELECGRAITSASRARRPQETDGIDYNFVPDNATFEKMIEEGKFIEWVQYKEKDGFHYKGMPRSIFERVINGEHVVARIDISRAGCIQEFIADNFPYREAMILLDSTIGFFLSANLDQVAKRAKRREGDNYREENYTGRWTPEKQQAREGDFSEFFIVENVEGHPEQAAWQIRQVVKMFKQYREEQIALKDPNNLQLADLLELI
jgi:guanylate kinase